MAAPKMSIVVPKLPHEKTAMMLMRPQICTVEGSALVYVIARPA